MRSAIRFLDAATFDPSRPCFSRQRLLARVLLDISVTVLWRVALHLIGVIA